MILHIPEIGGRKVLDQGFSWSPVVLLRLRIPFCIVVCGFRHCHLFQVFVFFAVGIIKDMGHRFTPFFNSESKATMDILYPQIVTIDVRFSHLIFKSQIKVYWIFVIFQASIVPKRIKKP